MQQSTNPIKVHLYSKDFESANSSTLLSYLKTIDNNINYTEDNLIILCDTSDIDNDQQGEYNNGVGSFGKPQYILYKSKQTAYYDNGVGSFDSHVLSNYFWPTQKRLDLDNPNTNEAAWPKMWRADIGYFNTSNTLKKDKYAADDMINESSPGEMITSSSELKNRLENEINTHFDVYISSTNSKLADVYTQHQDDHNALWGHGQITLSDIVSNTNPNPRLNNGQSTLFPIYIDKANKMPNLGGLKSETISYWNI